MIGFFILEYKFIISTFCSYSVLKSPHSLASPEQNPGLADSFSKDFRCTLGDLT